MIVPESKITKKDIDYYEKKCNDRINHHRDRELPIGDAEISVSCENFLYLISVYREFKLSQQTNK